jgi:hypothetical protein
MIDKKPEPKRLHTFLTRFAKIRAGEHTGPAEPGEVQANQERQKPEQRPETPPQGE